MLRQCSRLAAEDEHDNRYDRRLADQAAIGSVEVTLITGRRTRLGRPSSRSKSGHLSRERFAVEERERKEDDDGKNEKAEDGREGG